MISFSITWVFSNRGTHRKIQFERIILAFWWIQIIHITLYHIMSRSTTEYNIVIGLTLLFTQTRHIANWLSISKYIIQIINILFSLS